MLTVVYGRAAVEVCQPSGELVPYLIEDGPRFGSSWVLTKPDAGRGERYTVALTGGAWSCTCADRKYRGRPGDTRLKGQPCKHAEAVIEMLNEANHQSETVVRHADGGRVVLALGVRISVGRRGGVVALSDWSRAGELVRAGVLRLDPWNGPGLEGHDTYTLSENHQ